MREGVKPQHDYGEYERGSCHQRAVYETMEEADSVWRKGKRVRYEAPKALPSSRRRAPIFAQEHVSNHWFLTGRLGLHAYAAQGLAWEQTWIQKTAGDLPASFEAIAKTFEAAVPKIRKLLEELAREQERQQKEWEEQRKRWRREEEERRKKEEEAARLKRIQEEIASWRMARDIRGYVAEIHALVKDAELTEGGRTDQELTSALKYAEAIDPLTSWRKDIEKVKAEAVNKPCPDCGKVHDADAEDRPTEKSDERDSEPTTPEARAADDSTTRPR